MFKMLIPFKWFFLEECVIICLTAITDSYIPFILKRISLKFFYIFIFYCTMKYGILKAQ